MTKILIVCLGNICRSPLAEGILLHLVKEKKLSIIIDSAGTSDYHIDEPPDTRTIANAKKIILIFLRYARDNFQLRISILSIKFT